MLLLDNKPYNKQMLLLDNKPYNDSDEFYDSAPNFDYSKEYEEALRTPLPDDSMDSELMQKLATRRKIPGNEFGYFNFGNQCESLKKQIADKDNDIKELEAQISGINKKIVFAHKRAQQNSNMINPRLRAEQNYMRNPRLRYGFNSFGNIMGLSISQLEKRLTKYKNQLKKMKQEYKKECGSNTMFGYYY